MSARRSLYPALLPAAGLSALLLAPCPLAAQAAADPDPIAALGEILGAIRTLESENDAKCQATATRLENLMYGTPLAEQARFEKIRLQKEWILDLWQRASVAARAAGRHRVEVRDFEPLLAQALRSHTGENGDVEVALPAGGSVRLSAVDVRQYASVAYALRAVLAVQQDLMLSGGGDTLPADQSGLDAVASLLDLHTLAALSIADASARRHGSHTVDGPTFATAWERVSGPGRPSEGTTVEASGGPPGAPSDLPVLRAIIREKLTAYEAYNQIDRRQAEALFLRNTERFYARRKLPPGEQNVASQKAFEAGIVELLGRLLKAAEEAALAEGDGLIRSPALGRAAQALYPHEVDDLEDVTFFPNLPRDRRFKLESYDMDSFRDLGVHWSLLELTLQRLDPPLGLDLDPFAAERVAEMAAQLGVLLFRIGGDISRDEARGRYLTAEDMLRAERAIPVLAELSARQPAVATGSPIASAAGSGDPGGVELFTDVTDAVGLEFRHRTSDWLSRLRRTLPVTPPTFSGGGVAAEDVDGDELMDLLLVGGMGNALLLNDGAGGFVDVTEAAGVSPVRSDGYPGEARQPVIADLDNDGLQDIFITYANDPHRLFRNLGEGRFEDVTATAGLGGAGLIGGPATVFDFDRDGLLDIYIGYFGNYLGGVVPQLFEPLDREPADSGGDGGQIEESAAYTGDLPTLSRENDNALPNQLFRNLGGMRFEDRSDTSGTASRGWTQAVSHSDLNLDGWQDLIVANDFGRNALYLNRGGERFEDATDRLGMTGAYHSMNVGIADVNRDDHPDLYISNINTLLKDTKYVLPTEDTTMDLSLDSLSTMRVQESSKLYVSTLEEGGLSELRVSAAVDPGVRSVGWAWDADFFDLDNDGDDDLYVLNGANEYRVLKERWSWKEEGRVNVVELTHHNQPNVLYLNEQGRLRDLSARSGGADFVGSSRSAAYLDFDEDGDLDVAINNFQSEAVFLRNNAEGQGNNWLKVRLVGDPQRGSNRDAIGARLIATTPGGQRIWREVHGGSGYLSMEPKQQHLGLGGDTQADLEITWPNGERQVVRGLAANGSYRIEQGRSAIPLASTAGG